MANCFGRLKALKWGLNINILGVLFCMLVGLYPNYFLLLIGRLITGLGSAAGLTCTFMLINEWLPEEQRKTAMAYSILSFALGIGLSVFIGGLITQYSQWQGCFVFLFVQGLIMRAGICVFDETLLEIKPFNISVLVQNYAKALQSYKLLIFSLIWGACSAVGYCYSAAAPQIANQYLLLRASEYGYWNFMNIVGMLIGGLTARVLMQRLSVIKVIILGYIGCCLGLISLFAMYTLKLNSTFIFFISTSFLYCFSSYLFAGGSYIASNAINDKASSSSMMSFINMGFATSSVVMMGYLSSNPFISFLSILGIVFFLTFILFIGFWIKKQ